MAGVPTSEDSARHILDTFLHFGCRPGELLLLNSLFSSFLKAPWKPADIPQGMSFAVEKGWVEDLGNNRFKITESGFHRQARNLS